MLNLYRGRGDGIRLKIDPSAEYTHLDIVVHKIEENQNGRLQVQLGFMAPQAAEIRRHETLYADELLDVDTSLLTEGDRAKLVQYARNLPSRPLGKGDEE